MDADQGYDEERFQSAVHGSFKCPICQNILKRPVQCRKNEHYFCKYCITYHLDVNYKRCPLCQEDLTEETLERPSRHIVKMLSELKLSCDNSPRGCGDIVKLDALETHLKNCLFSPTPCRNQGCAIILNKRDRKLHEQLVCKFRLLKCRDCGQEVRSKDYDEHVCLLKLRRENNDLKDQMKQLTRRTEERFSAQEECMKEMKNQMKMITQINGLPTDDFIVVGGYDGTSCLNSAEMYSCSTGAWVPLPSLARARESPSSFVYDNQVFVCGGEEDPARPGSHTESTDTIERLHIVGQEPKEWLQLEDTLPFKCNAQTTTIYQNSLIMSGGLSYSHYENIKYEGSNSIYEILVNQQYRSNLVCHMPEAIFLHGAVLINDNVIIVGGRTTVDTKVTVDTIIGYDIMKRECKVIGKLPYAVCGMATVSHCNNLIVIGGIDVNHRTLNKVIMFNVVTGQCEMLPNMNVGRATCTAIISGNVIVVMGGKNGEEYLNSVEFFNLNNISRRWKELPSMAIPRSSATATVIPQI